MLATFAPAVADPMGGRGGGLRGFYRTPLFERTLPATVEDDVERFL